MSKGRTKTCECPHRGMGKTVGDLTLDDEHMSVGVDDTLQEAAKRLLTISGGIVVVLGDEHRVKGSSASVNSSKHSVRALTHPLFNATNTWRWISCRSGGRTI